MSSEQGQERMHGLLKWIASAACVVIFLIPFVDEWDWSRPVLFPFAGIVAIVAACLWFADAARRARRPLKIGCCAALGFILVLWGVSIVCYCSYYGTRCHLDFGLGGIHLVAFPDLSAIMDPSELPAPLGWGFYGPGFPRGASAPTALGLYMPELFGWDYPNFTIGILTIRLPFWLPAVIISLPTALLFYQDRRRLRPGCCRRCGYDLTANVSGVCPECGGAIPEEDKELVRQRGE